MATITAQNIVDDAKKTLQDETSVQWTEAELLKYLNNGQRAVVLLKPDAYVANENLLLATGTKQAIPAAGYRLIRVTRNMGTGGSTPGDVVTEADMDILDRADRAWHSSTAAAVVENFMFNEHDPKVFYVKPPQPTSGQGYVELIYSKAPTDILIGANITLDDVYANALYQFIMHRAHSKEVDESNEGKSAAYYALFTQELGLKTKIDDVADADRRVR